MYESRTEIRSEILKRLMEGDPEKGVRRLVWLPNRLDKIVEETRKKFGMRKSAFYRMAIIDYLDKLGVLEKKAKEKFLS